MHRYSHSAVRMPLHRLVWLPALLIAIVLLAAIALLANTAWRNLQRLEPIHTHLAYLTQLQEIGLRLQQSLVESKKSGQSIDEAKLQQLHSGVSNLIATRGFHIEETDRRLRQLEKTLADTSAAPPSAFVSALSDLRKIIADETRSHDQLLKTVDHDTRFELQVSTVIAVAFPLFTLLLIFLLRKRILQPLNNLGKLMTRLAQQDYRTVAAPDADPLLHPLFANYNHMVNRLAELERAHRERRQLLEQEVRTAAQALLEQQRNLARAERLAAIGEVSAGLAHELRNPLAGVQLAMENLRGEMSDVDQRHRVDLVSGELKRITHMLNSLLNQARHAPEPAVEVDLAETVRQTLALARFQIPERISIKQDIASDIRCRLPEGNLRQALLNLVLNSAQATGDNPGHIVIEAQRRKDRLWLSVYDDGPGFPSELLRNGIRAFASWQENGTGLGLAMARRFSRDLGGDLQLSNRQPHGACVTLSLPCI